MWPSAIPEHYPFKKKLFLFCQETTYGARLFQAVDFLNMLALLIIVYSQDVATTRKDVIALYIVDIAIVHVYIVELLITVYANLPRSRLLFMLDMLYIVPPYFVFLCYLAGDPLPIGTLRFLTVLKVFRSLRVFRGNNRIIYLKSYFLTV